MSKAFIFTMDSIIAISIVIMMIFAASYFNFETVMSEKGYEKLNYVADDTLNLLSYLKVYEARNTPTIKGLIGNGTLTDRDLNKTVLDLIASLWYGGNTSIAGNISKEILENLGNDTCVGLWVENQTIYSSCNVSAQDVAVSSRIESGYQAGRPAYGFIARAFLTSIKGKKDSAFVYFGGYVGEGNICRKINISNFNSIIETYLEVDPGTNFSLYINNKFSGNFTKSSGGGGKMRADKWIVCNDTYNPKYCLNFTTGSNLISFNFTGNESFIGGGYLRVTYNTSELAVNSEVGTSRYWFPGIEGFINLYSSFYVPGTLNNISARVHYYNGLTYNGQGIPVYLTIGGKQVFRSNKTGEQDIILTNQNFTDAFGSSDILINTVSKKTVPIRFGTETFMFLGGKGVADAVLITDVSGSMSSCDVYAPTGLICDCAGTLPPCNRTRLNVAKDVDKNFVEGILKIPGNRVGLTSYTTTFDDSHPLSENETSLDAEINSYYDKSATCVSCGIEDATAMLAYSQTRPTVAISERSNWLYSEIYPSSDPPNDLQGRSWTHTNYTDDSWSSGNAILGFENVGYLPSVNTILNNPSDGNFYFRKNFTVENASNILYGKLFVLSDDRAEVYINGNLIDTDAIEHRAYYWNRPSRFNETFEDGDIIGWDTSGQANWYATTGQPHTGSWSARAGSIYHNEETWILRSVDGPTDLSFWWRTSSRSGDYLLFCLDNPACNKDYQYIRRISGSTSWQNVKYSIPSGPHDIIWKYHKNGDFLTSGSDTGWIDDITNISQEITINPSYFVNGKNVIAVKLLNNDGGSAKFDLRLETIEPRKRAMLVMSDGIANRIINGTSTTESRSKKEAIEKACHARSAHGIDVYAVAFGISADATTMKRIACWNCTACNSGVPEPSNPNCWVSGESYDTCSKFYTGNSDVELMYIYQKIAQDIAELGYSAQTINITGNVSRINKLFGDSYIGYNFTPIELPPYEYGEIEFTREDKKLKDISGDTITKPYKEGWYNISSKVKVVDAKMTSYSSEYWTDMLNISNSSGIWNKVYRLGDYGNDYQTLGDPFIVQIPTNLISSGNNSIRIGTGISFINDTGGSPDDRLIYTMRAKGSVGYGDAFGIFDDAKNDAKQRLINDVSEYVNVTKDDIDIETKTIRGIQWLWGPSLIKIIAWSNKTI